MTSALTDVKKTSPTIKANGSDLSDAARMALVQMRINRGLSTTGRMTLRFIDIGYAVSSGTDFSLGAEVKVSLDTATLFIGEVTGFALDSDAGGVTNYVVTVDDRSFRLARGYHTEAYLQMSGSDIVAKLASGAGLTSSVSGMPSTTYEYLAQQGSDLAFVDALTKRGNCVWWMDNRTLHVGSAGTSSGTTATVKLGEDLLDFSVRASGLRPTAVSMKGWDPAQKTDIVGAGSSASSLTSDAVLAQPFGSTKPDSAFGAAELIVNHANPDTQDEATTLATSLNWMLASDAVVARGTVNVDTSLAPGMSVKVDNAGPGSGTYLVSEVEYVYSTRGFYTKFVAGSLRQSLLVDSFATVPSDPGLRNFGLASAVITKVGTASPNLGMVKVKYTGGNSELESGWARVVTIGGGNNRGNVFLPEINDEVLIGFERGDTRHPVVLGGLYNGKDAFAAGADVLSDGKIAYRRITSREGHVIELSDGPADNKMHVMVTTKGGQKLRLGDDGGEITYTSGKPFKITIGSSSIEFDGQGNIAVKGTKITLEAQTDVAITGNANVNVKGTAKLALEGTAQVAIKGGLANLESDGITTVKGAMVKIN